MFSEEDCHDVFCISLLLSMEDKVAYDDFMMLVERLSKLVGMFGKGFQTIQYELDKSLKVLRGNSFGLSLDSDIMEIIFKEIMIGGYEVTESILWISRCLNCLHYTFSKIARSKEKDESLQDIMVEAFNKTIGMHHNWFGNHAFTTLSKNNPGLPKLLEQLTKIYGDKKKLSLRLHRFERALYRLVCKITGYFHVYNLETQIHLQKGDVLSTAPP